MMPFVNVKVAGELSQEQRENIIRGITEVLETVARKPREVIHVAIDEVPRKQWGWKGKTL